MNDHDIMYALDFVSFLDRKFNITLREIQNDGADVVIFTGNKSDAKRFLADADVDYILCDTSSMYTYGIDCTLYIEAY